MSNKASQPGLPRLTFHGSEPLVFPGVGRTLRNPERYWPPSLLERSALEARAGSMRICALTDPDLVGRVLNNRSEGFPRARLQNRMLSASYGDNLVEGDRLDWRRQRREIAQPLTSDRAQMVASRIVQATDRILAEWDALPAGTPVDVIRDARRLALDALWRSFFADTSEALEADPLVDSTAREIDGHVEATLVQHLEALRPLAEQAIAAAEQAKGESLLGGAPGDLNTMVLFLHAGHDNVTATLAWALWLLAKHPEIQAAVRDEWRAANAGNGVIVTDLSAYPLTGAVVRETLRLYPPIMHLIRDVAEDIEVDGRTIAAGFTAVLSLYGMHRNRQWWDEPDAFRPDRFVRGGDAPKRRAVWLPFGTGPRACIGASFAQLQLVLAIGRIVDARTLRANPDHDFTCRVDFVLRPDGRAPLFADVAA